MDVAVLSSADKGTEQLMMFFADITGCWIRNKQLFNSVSMWKTLTFPGLNKQTGYNILNLIDGKNFINSLQNK